MFWWHLRCPGEIGMGGIFFRFLQCDAWWNTWGHLTQHQAAPRFWSCQRESRQLFSKQIKRRYIRISKLLSKLYGFISIRKLTARCLILSWKLALIHVIQCDTMWFGPASMCYQKSSKWEIYKLSPIFLIIHLQWILLIVNWFLDYNLNYTPFSGKVPSPFEGLRKATAIQENIRRDERKVGSLYA